MKEASSPIKGNMARAGRVKVFVNFTWLFVIPLLLWAEVNYLIPIFGATLNPAETWTLAMVLVLLAGASLAGHILAHELVSSLRGSTLPAGMAVFIFGDAAQAWPPAASLGKETLASLAGLLFNIAIAGLAYLLWNLQLNTYLTISMLFLCGFNLWLAIINLLPAFPFDGGRLVRVIGWGLLDRKAAFSRLALRSGYLIGVFLAGWGIFLIAQHARFSLETGLATLLFSGLILTGLRLQQVNPAQDGDIQSGRSFLQQPVQALVAALLILSMLADGASLLLTNDGLEAPGFALSVEPMVQVPAQYRHVHSGTFILTSVVTQAPITAGEWLAGKIFPAIKIVPPETIVPENSTPQKVAQQGYQMLDQSETTAEVIGLQLAGYPAQITGKGVQIDSILADSPAAQLLSPGDVITAINGKPVQMTTDLINEIKAQAPDATVRLLLERNGKQMELNVPLMPPAATGGPPRLGITIEQWGFDARLPFPVKINSQKIVGGPSAGLMFTLTVFNALSPVDITGGRKIAGTGTINPDGSVGPIGGVQQKVAAAEAAGAEYFLSPVDNYKDALSVAKHIKVVQVATAQQAVEFLKSLPLPPASLQPPALRVAPSFGV